MFNNCRPVSVLHVKISRRWGRERRGVFPDISIRGRYYTSIHRYTHKHIKRPRYTLIHIYLSNITYIYLDTPIHIYWETKRQYFGNQSICGRYTSIHSYKYIETKHTNTLVYAHKHIKVKKSYSGRYIISLLTLQLSALTRDHIALYCQTICYLTKTRPYNIPFSVAFSSALKTFPTFSNQRQA